jgi:fumarylacetoacetase
MSTSSFDSMVLVDPARHSFVASAQGSEFPLQNLPYGVFMPADGPARVGVAIGAQVLDLAAAAERGWIRSVPRSVLACASLNALARLGRAAWSALRTELVALLAQGSALAGHADAAVLLHDASAVRMALPFDIPGYTDFYASEHHAFNCGVLFRGPENALPPNWKHMPIGYNGRASSVVVSGTPLHRPNGQLPGADGVPSWGPTRALDFELEIGAFIGADTALGHSVAVDEAWSMVFGLVLLNDWSARDVQRWEYVPLGPFQGKAFGTSISPWVVPLDALEPFKVALDPQQPAVLPYLQEREHVSYDVALQVDLQTAEGEQACISTSNLRHLYWSFAQQVAHHTGSGCNLRVGDLLGTGTISGPEPTQLGCLLEMTKAGQQPLQVGAQQRRYLEDGDRVTFRGTASSAQFTIGFGSLTGQILPAR